MRLSTALFYARGVEAMQSTQSDLAKTQLQVASGKQILVPSDDPAGAKRLLDLEESLGLTRRYLTNADDAVSRLAFEESALSGATNVLHRVRELAIQANNATMTDPDRRALAAELEIRVGELAGLANSKDGNNEYVFAGFATHSEPFAPTAGGSYSYSGDQGRRNIQIAPGYHVEIGDSGVDVFQRIANGNGVFATDFGPANTGSGVIDPGGVVDHSAWVPDTYTLSFPTATTYEVRDGTAALVTSGPFVSGAEIVFNGIKTAVEGVPAAGDTFTVTPSSNQDVFTTLQNFLTALNTSADNDVENARITNALNRVLTDVDQAMENVRGIRARVGARLNTIDTERDVNEGFALHLQQAQSEIQDLDYAEAVSRLSQQSAALQAAQQSFARIQNLSLFNYLN